MWDNKIITLKSWFSGLLRRLVLWLETDVSEAVKTSNCASR